jgi:hypothetical protein
MGGNPRSGSPTRQERNSDPGSIDPIIALYRRPLDGLWMMAVGTSKYEVRLAFHLRPHGRLATCRSMISGLVCGHIMCGPCDCSVGRLVFRHYRNLLLLGSDLHYSSLLNSPPGLISLGWVASYSLVCLGRLINFPADW